MGKLTEQSVKSNPRFERHVLKGVTALESADQALGEGASRAAVEAYLANAERAVADCRKALAR